MAADALMVLLLPVLMAYSLVGETAHELLGLAMFALFVCHHLLHRGWMKSVFRGKYTPARAVNTAVDLLLLAFMLAQPVSGVLMSKHILSGVTIPGAAAPARLLHLCLAYWGFVLLSVHLGLHLRVILPKRLPKAVSAALLIVMAFTSFCAPRSSSSMTASRSCSFCSITSPSWRCSRGSPISCGGKRNQRNKRRSVRASFLFLPEFYRSALAKRILRH